MAGMSALEKVKCPTLLIVGRWDEDVIRFNSDACKYLRCTNELIAIPVATHLFTEPGTLEETAHQAAVWFGLYLKSTSARLSTA